MFHSNDSVLLTDGIKCWILRIEDISLLEARQDFTLVHFPDGKVLIRRSLGACERMLDSSIFFRASRGCIVNLSQVKQPRLSNDGGASFFCSRTEKRSCFLGGKPFSSVRHEVFNSGLQAPQDIQEIRVWP